MRTVRGRCAPSAQIRDTCALNTYSDQPVYEAGKNHARASAPDHAYYAAVKDCKNSKRAALSEARKIIRQACHIPAKCNVTVPENIRIPAGY